MCFTTTVRLLINSRGCIRHSFNDSSRYRPNRTLKWSVSSGTNLAHNRTIAHYHILRFGNIGNYTRYSQTRVVSLDHNAVNDRWNNVYHTRRRYSTNQEIKIPPSEPRELPITREEKKRGIACLTRFLIKEMPIVLPTFLALMASSALISLFPTVVGRYINSFSAHDVPSMLEGGCFVMGAALASFIKTTLSGFAKLRMSRRIREDLFAALLKKDAGFFDTTSSGKLTSVLATDARVSAGIIDYLSQFVRSTISFTAGIYFSLKVAHISLIMHTMLPIAASLFIMVPLSRCVQRQMSIQMRRLATLISFSEEKISHIKTVKTFNAESFEMGVFGEKIHQLFKASIKGIFYGASMNFVAVGAVGSLILLMANTSATLVLNGTMKIGDVTSLLMYSALVGGSLQSLTSSFAEIQKCIGTTVNLAKYIDEEPGNNKLGVVELLPITPPTIEFNNVTFTYPSRPGCTILRNLSFLLPAGKTLVILGESGCGKSSILQLLLGLYTPDSGTITFNGKSIKNIDLHHLRTMTAWIEQQATLFDDTIRNNVLYGHSGKEDQLAAVYNQSGLINVMNELPNGDQTVVGQMGRALSGGQRQRISIARMLIRNPKLVLLDEVTSALDMESERQINKILMDHLRDKTAIIITHRTNLLFLADYIMVMNAGEVCQFGPKGEVLQNPCSQLSKIFAAM